MEPIEKICEIIRERQQHMQKEYDARTPIGTSLEIPWEGHLPVKVLMNVPANKPAGKVPYFINAHGGGFIEGDAMTMGTFCQMLADKLGIVVMNLNYRLSPDYNFGYQIDEARILRQYVKEHQDELGIDPSRCGIGGFSAGATLALSCVVRSIQNQEDPFTCCVAVYPVTDTTPGALDPNAPYQPADEVMIRAIDYYCSGQHFDPACSPLLADDSLLAQFPPTILITCGKDALATQGREFAARLVKCGVKVIFEEYKTALHGFVEVNRPDYFLDDPRKTPEQLDLCKKAEEMIAHGLSAMLF